MAIVDLYQHQRLFKAHLAVVWTALMAFDVDKSYTMAVKCVKNMRKTWLLTAFHKWP